MLVDVVVDIGIRGDVRGAVADGVCVFSVGVCCGVLGGGVGGGGDVHADTRDGIAGIAICVGGDVVDVTVCHMLSAADIG